MQQAIMQIMNDWGYIGVLALILIENVFPPIPSEVILVFGGALTANEFGGKLGIAGMVLAATLGSLSGAIILYYIGKILKAERLKKIIRGKTGKVLRVKPADIDRADSWFRTKGSWSVLVCRCVPVLRSMISIPAGMSEMKMGKFIVLTVIGSMIWNTILVVMGHYLGRNWESVLGFFDHFQTVVIAICVVVFIGAMYWWFMVRGRKKKAQASHQKSN